MGGDRRVGGGGGQARVRARGRGWGTGQRVGQGDRLGWLLPWKGVGEGSGHEPAPLKEDTLRRVRLSQE